MILRKNFNLSILLQLFLGLLWVSFILWVRLFRDYLPRDWSELLALPLWRTGYLSLLFLVLEIFALHQFFWPIAKQSPLSWALERLPGKRYWEYLVYSPRMIFPYIFSQLSQQRMGQLSRISLWTMDFIRLRCGKGYYAWILPILVALVPLWLVGSIFAWEVLIQGKLKYFYLLFPLLLLPLLGRAVLSILVQMAQLNLDTLNFFLKVTQVESKVYDFQARSSMDVKLFQEMVRMYKISLLFSQHERRLDGVKNYFFLKSAPLLWALYLSGWGTVLCHQLQELAWNVPWFP